MTTAIKRKTLGLIVIVGIALLFSTLLQAQSQRLSIDDRVKSIKDSLKLSDEQSKKIKVILQDQREEMTTAMNENRDNHDAMQAARQEIMKKTDEKIKAILTDEQAKEYDEMVKARRAHMGRRTQESGK